jgi:signal-transduction protein with cAMP-binding, CBS, and nucleotidyltransferase domain
VSQNKKDKYIEPLDNTQWRNLMETSVRIGEVMSRNLITNSPDATVGDVAKTMDKNKVGSVIITENGDNEGIVTERDICFKVVAKDKNPSITLAREIMTTDLVTISPKKTLTDAAKLMVKKNIRRLAVSNKGRVVGMITATDILSVSPKTIEILREVYEIYSHSDESTVELSEELTEGGTCEECGVFTDNLTRMGSRYICDDCREDEG